MLDDIFLKFTSRGNPGTVFFNGDQCVVCLTPDSGSEFQHHKGFIPVIRKSFDSVSKTFQLKDFSYAKF